MSTIWRQILVVFAIVAMIVINALANVLPINGQQTGAISERFDILFVPAGYVFSIWGLIYLGLLAYAGYQVLPRQRDEPRLRALDGPVILSCVANGAWLIAWHYERFVLSLVLMVVLLASLIAVYQRLDASRHQSKPAQRWFVELPFSIYLGWITVATISNASVVLRDLGWGGWGLDEFVWFVVVLVVALVIAGAIAWRRRDVAYLAVLVWAFVGIAVKHADAPAIVWTAGASATLVMLMIVYAGLSAGRSRDIPPQAQMI